MIWHRLALRYCESGDYDSHYDFSKHRLLCDVRGCSSVLLCNNLPGNSLNNTNRYELSCFLPEGRRVYCA